ncbi:MAG: radical SAM protein [Chloroflexi bacterium]|nr:radical SAM protein [Chloroflexota bacterium]
MSVASSVQFEAGYLTLYRTGELERRANSLEARLKSCDICPRQCHVDRLSGEIGFCRCSREALVASACAHLGEEPALSGTKGSGTIFFGGCTLKCVYCQNYQISQGRLEPEWEIDYRGLAERMIYLQDGLGCHNINLVSPSHFAPQILMALVCAVPMGLQVPLVYNTNGYDSLATLRALDGIVDVYLPDIRYASDTWARKFSQGADYVPVARGAISEMYRQVGNLVTDDDGTARRGLIVRLLVLPNDVGGCEDSLRWLAEDVSRDVTVSVMSQYFPCHRAARVPLLSRKIYGAEYARVVHSLERLGLQNGWIQEIGSAESYVPDFKREGHPFGKTV